MTVAALPVYLKTIVFLSQVILFVVLKRLVLFDSLPCQYEACIELCGLPSLGSVLSSPDVITFRPKTSQNTSDYIELKSNKKDGYRQQNVRQRQKLISIIDYDVCILEYLQQFFRDIHRQRMA